MRFRVECSDPTNVTSLTEQGAEYQSRRLPVVRRRTDVSERRHVFIFRVRPDDSGDEKKDIYRCRFQALRFELRYH